MEINKIIGWIGENLSLDKKTKELFDSIIDGNNIQVI